MSTSFPTDKTQPFVAENGVTYYWDSDRWRVKTYKKEDDERLPYRLGTDKAARDGEAAVELVDNQDNYSNVKFFGERGISCSSNIQGILVSGDHLQQQIDDLGVSKGKVVRYTVTNNSGSPVTRPGEFATNTSFPNNVSLMSFGTEDMDSALTKPMATGDIIETINPADSKVNRYKITDAAAAPTVIAVEYISGSDSYILNDEKQFYIYPQNSSGVGGTPVGSIMMWVNSKPPVGWFKLKGEAFDISLYPLLHAYLENSDGYRSGKLPDWRGHYPGQLGDHLNGDVGIKLPQKTAMPSGGAPYHPNSIPNGNTRTFNGSGGTNAYSDGIARPAITEGWDDVTRPKTVAVHFIIKHD